MCEAPCGVCVPRLHAPEWQLFGEGARNLVLRYRGAQPSLAGCVLRVPKAAATTPEGGVAALDADATLERELWRDVPAFERAKCDVERNWAYVAHVLAPLLGERHAAPGTLVMLPATFMPDVIAGAESCPGSDEQHQAQLAAGGDCRGAVAALLLPDHTLFCAPRAVPTLHKAAPVVAVEIKPKCGFLPHAPTLLQECVKRRVSRFVLHQHLKVTQGRVPKVSGYCPLDLFSLEPERMHAALRALLDAPQNNFTCRCDGSVVFGGAGQFGTAPKEDVAALGAALDGFAPEGLCHTLRIDLLVRLLVIALQSHDVLRRLCAVQQLDAHDVEGAFQAYCGLLGDECAAPAAGSATCTVDAVCHSARAALRDLPRERALAIVRDFLTAQTAKDCAIIVALQRLSDDASPVSTDELLIREPVTGLHFRCKAAFVDLDLKRVASMRRYVKLDREVVAHFSARTMQEHAQGGQGHSG